MGGENDDLDDLLRGVEELMVVEDPEAEPYRSKYKARECLVAWRGGDYDQNDEDGVKKHEEEEMARVAVRLGRIALETEEPHVADKELRFALRWFVPGLHETVEEMTG